MYARGKNVSKIMEKQASVLNQKLEKTAHKELFLGCCKKLLRRS